jgi:hypothetical protein
VIAGAGARHIEQMSLAVIDLFEIGIIGDILDALLQRISSSHAKTATARKSSPFARCIVPIESLPGVISMLSLSSTAGIPPCLTAFRARRSSRVERTKTPISCG